MIEIHELIRALNDPTLEMRMPVRVISEEGDVFDIKSFSSDNTALVIHVELSE